MIISVKAGQVVNQLLLITIPLDIMVSCVPLANLKYSQCELDIDILDSSIVFQWSLFGWAGKKHKANLIG